MRVALTLFVCALGLFGQAASELQRAEQELERLRDLVKAGAIAPVRLADAEQALGDAKDLAILNRTLYGKLTAMDLTEEQSREMLAAAERRLERETGKLARREKLVDSGVMARSELAPIEQEIESRRLALELSQSRAKLLGEIAEAIHREQLAAALAAIIPAPGEIPVMEHFEGDGVLTAQALKAVETAYEKQFSAPLPISANGETEMHRLLGFDHRGRVDVAITPDQPEGVWLRAYLEKLEIPYYAFRAPVRGKATGAHIHIGPGSTRLRSAD